jgi:membrane protease YdiL (CAAX protease family)
MKLLKFNPDKTTVTAFIMGIMIIVLSIAMTLFSGSKTETAMNIVFRDFLMIYVVGFCLPILYVQRNEPTKYEVLGITKRKLKMSLALNILFSALLLANFILSADELIRADVKTLFATTYIFVAGIFEMVCIYGFIRHYLERAFGVIPAILLTAVIYSFHHAGFQPEFLKLFFVGIMYCSVFYITRNIFIIFPFFCGVGATWDVLIESTAGQSLQNITSFLVAICLLIAMLTFTFISIKSMKGNNDGLKNKIAKQL